VAGDAVRGEPLIHPGRVAGGARLRGVRPLQGEQRVRENPSCQLTSEARWQAAQSVGKPAVAWLGVVVAWYSSRWQLTHVEGNPWYTPDEWQAAHGCERAPQRGKAE